MAKKKKKPKSKKRPKKAKVLTIKKTEKPAEVGESIYKAKIMIIGIGGGGGSIVSEISSRVEKVDFVVANTDFQALRFVTRKVKRFQFGQAITRGLGCGMDPRLGQRAAQTEKEKIAKLFQNVDFCVLVASLGGGTGSGALIEFGKIARDSGLITFGIFTLPFKFEGERKAQIARNYLEKIAPNLNAIAIIPNEKIFQIIDKKTPLKEAFSAINRILSKSLEGLVEMVYSVGLINIDWADLKSILDGRGKLAYLNCAEGKGPARAEEATKKVLQSPLNEYNIQGAERILFNIASGTDLKMKEVEQISQTISDFNKKAKIIFGVSYNKRYGDKIKITLLAVGCDREGKLKKEKPKKVTKRAVKRKKKRIIKVKKVKKSKFIQKKKPVLKPKNKVKKKKVIPVFPVRNKVKLLPVPKKKVVFKKVNNIQKKTSITEENNHKSEVYVPGPEKEVLATGPLVQGNNLSNGEEKKAQQDYKVRRNALDLKKDIEREKEEMVDQEKRWDIPAFLRRKMKK